MRFLVFSWFLWEEHDEYVYFLTFERRLFGSSAEGLAFVNLIVTRFIVFEQKGA